MTYQIEQFVQEIELCFDVSLRRKEQICNITPQFLEHIAQFDLHLYGMSHQSRLVFYILLNKLLICLKCEIL